MKDDIDHEALNKLVDMTKAEEKVREVMKDLLTGKNKEQFNPWFREYCMRYEYLNNTKVITDLPFEMQIGVYLAYYNSLGIHITVDLYTGSGDYFYKLRKAFKDFRAGKNDTDFYDSSDEAYKEAFEKVDEIINNSLK